MRNVLVRPARRVALHLTFPVKVLELEVSSETHGVDLS